MKQQNQTYFEFHRDTMGYDCYKKGVRIPKYIAFHKGQTPETLFRKNGSFEMKPRINN